MNRLIVTMMLIFALALGIAKLAHADAPVEQIQYTQNLSDGAVEVTRNTDGTVVRTATVSDCADCTPVPLKALADSLAKVTATATTLAAIQASLKDTTEKEGRDAIEKEQRRVELQKTLDEKKEACETSSASEVKMDKDRPYIKYVNFDSHSKASKKDLRTPHDEETSSISDDDSATTFDSPESVALGEGFSEKDHCDAEKLADDPDSALKGKLVASTLNEFLKLDAKFNAGLITPGSKEAIRYANLKSYVTALSNDQKYAGIIKQVILQRAMVADKNFDGFATQAGGSPQLAMQLRQSGGLSNAEISNFNTLLRLGKSASSASGDMSAMASLQQMQSKNIQGLVAKIDQNGNKTGSTSGNSYLSEYDRAGGVDSDYDKAHKEALRIARQAGRGHLLDQWDETEPKAIEINAMDPRAVNAPARFTTRNSGSSGTPFMNATAYSSNLNTGNSYVNSIPQAGQSQNGTNFGSSQQQQSNFNMSSFHIQPRGSS